MRRPYLIYFVTISIAPILALSAFPVLYRLGEPFGASTTPRRLAEIQHNRPEVVILPFDLRYNGDFKLRVAELQKPDVMWFSTSRAGTAREAMFSPYHFYNMSFTAWTAEQLTEIFERTTRSTRPHVAIISLDYFLFTDRWREGFSTTRQMIFDAPWRHLRSSLSDFFRATLKHRGVFETYANSPTRFVGTQTILSQEGFRNDGSYVFSQGHLQHSQENFRTAKFLVDSIPGSPEMSERDKSQIERLAKIARDRGVKLVAVQLPFIRAAVELLDTDVGYRRFSGVWRDFEDESTRAWLRGLGIAFFDLSHSSIDDDQDSFIDAYHPSEAGMTKVVEELSAAPAFKALLPQLKQQSTDVHRDAN